MFNLKAGEIRCKLANEALLVVRCPVYVILLIEINAAAIQTHFKTVCKSYRKRILRRLPLARYIAHALLFRFAIP